METEKGSRKRTNVKAGAKGKKKATTAAKKSRTRAGLVKKAIQSFEAKLDSAEVKATVADFVRLLQLEKEIKETEQPKEIKVTWVEPKELASESEE